MIHISFLCNDWHNIQFCSPSSLATAANCSLHVGQLIVIALFLRVPLTGISLELHSMINVIVV